jgi:hypothetical protein
VAGEEFHAGDEIAFLSVTTTAFFGEVVHLSVRVETSGVEREVAITLPVGVTWVDGFRHYRRTLATDTQGVVEVPAVRMPGELALVRITALCGSAWAVASIRCVRERCHGGGPSGPDSWDSR